MDATLARGRWTTAKTVRQYIDDGTLALAKLVWTKVQRKAVRQWSTKATRLLRRLRQVQKRFLVIWEMGGLVFSPIFFSWIGKWEVYRTSQPHDC